MGNIGFCNTNKQQSKTKLFVEDNFTNAICYGKTGSGKTSSFILPNISNRFRKNHGMLIYDFKGNLHSQVKYIASHFGKLSDVIEIGTQWGETINILEDIRTSELRDMYTMIYGGEGKDRYWLQSSYALLESLYLLIKDINNTHLTFSKINKLKIDSKIYLPSPKYLNINVDITFKNIQNICKSSDSLSRFLTHVDKFIDSLYKYIARVYIDIENIKPLQKYFADIVDLFESINQTYSSMEQYTNLEDSDSVSGKYGVIGVLSSVLMNVSLNKYLNHSTINIVDELRDGKIVIINVKEFDTNLLGLMNHKIYTKLQENFISGNKAVTIFIDEAQKVLHPNYLPDVDVCRESKFEYIFATQDKLLLGSTIGHLKTEELLKNIVEQYSFSTTELELEKFQYKNLFNNKTYTASSIFIDNTKQFNAEYAYQALNDINIKLYNYNTKKQYIFVHDNHLQETGCVKIKFEDQTLQLVQTNTYNIQKIENKLNSIVNKKVDKILIEV